MSTALEQDVRSRVALVRGELDRAVAALEDKWVKTEEVEHGLSGLRVLRPSLEDWAARGIAAITEDTTPWGRPWSAWIAAGNAQLDGIRGVFDLGDNATLQDIQATTAQAAAVVTAKAAATGRAVKKIVANTTAQASGAVQSAHSTLRLTVVAVGLCGLALVVWGLRR